MSGIGAVKKVSPPVLGMSRAASRGGSVERALSGWMADEEKYRIDAGAKFEEPTSAVERFLRV